MGWRLELGDCLDVLKTLEAGSVDSIVTDPPAGIAFMGKDWDCFRRAHNPADVGRDSVMGRMSAPAPASYGESDRGHFITFMRAAMTEALRVLKPGGHALVWALPRTSHWTATALEDAGFEIRDVCHHLFATGFPKSQDVGKFIDKMAGAEREVVGERVQRFGLNETAGWNSNNLSRTNATIVDTAPATDEAKQWDGWGTALKPAAEHWILCRKPLSETTIAKNVLKHGTGALNIAASRVERAAGDVPGWHETGSKGREGGYLGTDTFKIRDMPPEEVQARCGGGRWPPDVLLSHDETCGFEDGACHPACPVAEIDQQSGSRPTKRIEKPSVAAEGGTGIAGSFQTDRGARGYTDSGGASRFYPTFHYFPKPSRREREQGLEAAPLRTLNRVNPGGIEHDPKWAPVTVKNHHPTVKSRALMLWLIRLITPAGGCVLDPFAGSGSTGVAAVANGFSFLGIEKEPDYYAIAEKRIEFVANEAAGQMSLFEEYENA